MKLNLGRKNDIETAAPSDTEDDQTETDLTRLSKKDLLEIMLRQGEEIDALRAQVEDLQARLDKKEFELSKVGSIAEASLAVTDIFKEADKAAMIYLTNLKRMAEEGIKNE